MREALHHLKGDRVRFGRRGRLGEEGGVVAAVGLRRDRC